MKVLWVVNMVMPKLAENLGIQTSASGSWLIDFSDSLENSENHELAIVAVHGKTFLRKKIGRTEFFLLPGSIKNMRFYTESYKIYWKKIIENFKPDIIQIYGTEYTHAISLIRLNLSIPILVTTQGIMSKIKKYDFAGISIKDFLFNKKSYRKNNEIILHLMRCLSAKYENEMIKNVRYITCDTLWAKSCCLEINPSAKIYNLNFNLRKEFYESTKWSYEKIQKFNIFTNPGNLPLKGLHKLIEAIHFIKEFGYINIHLVVPSKVVDSVYGTIINDLIKKYNLETNIEFKGRLDSANMVEEMLKSHIVVVPSAIEGSSMILHEAMYLGVPVIATCRGGMIDFIEDGKDGFIYDFEESQYLAMRIIELFENKELCEKLSKNAIKKSESAHKRKFNFENCLKIYEEVIKLEHKSGEMK